MRKFWLNLVMLLLLLEIAAQLAVRVTSHMWFWEKADYALPRLYAADPALKWKLRSNLNLRFKTLEFDTGIKTNPQGFRDEDFSAKPPGLRILALGDSFTFGWGVQNYQRFGDILQQDFRKQGIEVTVYNAGVPGYGIEQEALLLKQLIPRIKPQMVLLESWIGDWDIITSDRMQAFPPYLMSSTAVQSLPGWMLQIRIWLYTHSAGFNLASRLCGQSHKDPFMTGEAQAVFMKGNYPGEIQQAQNRYFKALQSIAETLRQSHTGLMLLLIPCGFQFRSCGPDCEYDRPHRIIADYCSRHGITHLDFLAAFKGAAAGDPETQYYYRHDPHWNAAGHMLAAKLIGPGLKTGCTEKGLRDFVPGPGRD